MKLTKEGRTLALVMGMFDGYISKYGYLQVKHCVKQKEYLEWKRNLLIKNGIKVSEIVYIENNGYGAYEFRTKSYKFLRTYRKFLYCPNKKIASIKLLNKLEPIHLAIWYFDDGSLSKVYTRGKVSSNRLTISTCISKEENQIIIDFLKDKFDISFHSRKMKNKFALQCCTKEARKLIKIIYPYVKDIECMKYKLDVKPPKCNLL